MDVSKILEELRREHAQLGEAILSLERLSAGGKRRGRPPAWLQAQKTGRPADVVASGPKKKRGRKKKVQTTTAA